MDGGCLGRSLNPCGEEERENKEMTPLRSNGMDI